MVRAMVPFDVDKIFNDLEFVVRLIFRFFFALCLLSTNFFPAACLLAVLFNVTATSKIRVFLLAFLFGFPMFYFYFQ